MIERFHWVFHQKSSRASMSGSTSRAEMKRAVETVGGVVGALTTNQLS
jgi:hypothetical protein